MKEILIKLRDGLDPYDNRFMCPILEEMEEDCSILKESGLEDLWLSRGNTVGYVWSLSKEYTLVVWLEEVYKEKITCLNIIIDGL